MTTTLDANTLTIVGNIKSVSDYQEIKSAIDSLVNNHKQIVLEIKDSLSITSSVIGYLNKIILKDGIHIEMRIGDAQLLELLEDLNLKSVFNARKV